MQSMLFISHGLTVQCLGCRLCVSSVHAVSVMQPAAADWCIAGMAGEAALIERIKSLEATVLLAQTREELKVQQGKCSCHAY